jgi:hypothetical protein
MLETDRSYRPVRVRIACSRSVGLAEYARPPRLEILDLVGGGSEASPRP